MIASGPVPTYTADLGPPTSLFCIDGGLSGSGVCFSIVHKVIMVPVLFRSHLQVCFRPSGTRRKITTGDERAGQAVPRLSSLCARSWPVMEETRGGIGAVIKTDATMSLYVQE